LDQTDFFSLRSKKQFILAVIRRLCCSKISAPPPAFMRGLLKILKFLVFELWRWCLIILAGAAGAWTGIWSTGRFDILRELPNLTIAGIAIDTFMLSGAIGFSLFALSAWFLLIRRRRNPETLPES